MLVKVLSIITYYVSDRRVERNDTNLNYLYDFIHDRVLRDRHNIRCRQ